MGKKFLILGAGIVFLVLVFTLIVSLLRKKPEEILPTQKPSQETKEEPKVEDLTTIDPETISQEASENLKLATSFAQKWQTNAVLVYLSIKLASTTPNEGTEIYIFDAPEEPNNHFTFTLSQESKKYIRAVIPKEDYLGSDLKPVAFKYWQTNWLEAFQIAEKNGGKEFREGHLDVEVALNLFHTEPNGWLYWVIEYKTKEGDTLSIKINPYNKEIVKEAT